MTVTIPDMPNDWWPDTMTVSAKDGNNELGFAISEPTINVGLWPSLDALRRCLWMARYTPEEKKINYLLKETD